MKGVMILMVKKQAKPEEQLVPVTVRFTKGGYSAICFLSDKYKMSISEIVRTATDDRLSKFLGNIVYIYPDQGEQIMKIIGAVGTEMEKIRIELNRIGVNYNQEMKLKNIEAKYAKRTGFNAIKGKMQEIDDVKNGIDCVDADRIEALIDRYEAITKKAGELLCTLE